MDTLTMSAIAKMARVQRPVVSVWRTRFAHSDDPFPEPVRTETLEFDRVEVSEWLQRTGRGNNPNAVVESPLYSSALEKVHSDLDTASALLLLQHLSGDVLADLDPGEALAVLETQDVEAALPAHDAIAALADTQLVASVDELSEAAFSGAGVLARIARSFGEVGGRWANDALTAPAQSLVQAVVREVLRDRALAIAPHSPGGLLLAASLVTSLADDAGRAELAFAVPPAEDLRQGERLVWRAIAAGGHRVVPRQAPVGPSGGRLHLFSAVDAGDPALFFEAVDNLVLELAADDVLVVLGPEPLMLGELGFAERRRFFTVRSDYSTPLRYSARLPKGLATYGGRRRLALWVFANEQMSPDAGPRVVVADHSDTDIDADSAALMAADVAASIAGWHSVRAHAFSKATVPFARQVVHEERLVARPSSETVQEGGERLARIWELDSGILGDTVLRAATPRTESKALVEVPKGLGRDRPGVRLPDSAVDVLGPGAAPVIGPEEVRNFRARGKRGIDRLTLEEVAPRARYSEPGDVIYTATGGPPAAMVDHLGGNVVQYPARYFRCAEAPERENGTDGAAKRNEKRRLLPEAVAADIERQPGTDRKTWMLRTVAPDRAATLDELTAKIRTRRDRLLAQLADLDALRYELVDGLATGVLTQDTDENN